MTFYQYYEENFFSHSYEENIFLIHEIYVLKNIKYSQTFVDFARK